MSLGGSFTRSLFRHTKKSIRSFHKITRYIRDVSEAFLSSILSRTVYNTVVQYAFQAYNVIRPPSPSPLLSLQFQRDPSILLDFLSLLTFGCIVGSLQVDLMKQIWKIFLMKLSTAL